MASCRKTSPFKDVEGYVYSVFDVKIPTNPNSTRYFDFMLEEADEKILEAFTSQESAFPVEATGKVVAKYSQRNPGQQRQWQGRGTRSRQRLCLNPWFQVYIHT